MRTLQKLAKIPLISLLFGIYLFFILYLMQLPYLKTESVVLKSLDIRWSYSMNDVSTLFNLLGPEGLKMYKVFILIDFGYILSYSTLLSLCFTYLQHRIVWLGNWIVGMLWLTILLAILDVTENANTWLMINSFPSLSKFAVYFGSIITQFKWLATLICTGFLALTIISLVFKKVLSKWNNKKND